SSTLIKLYNAIQKRLDQENRYSRSQETLTFNNCGLQSISQTLFSEIIALCQKYFTPHIIAEIKKQTQQALCIKEAWRIVRFTGSTNIHYIILLHDGSFLCTCTWSISRRISCQHYFAVLLESNNFYNISAIRPHYNKPAPAFASASILSNQPILSNQFEKLTLIRKALGSKKLNKKFLQDRIRYKNDQENTIQVTNPNVIQTKDQPSLRQKSALELESRKLLQTINENSNHEESSKHGYTCSNCHMQEHNIRS
ncbi:11723_t:CDS:2, partial [Gigaspora margarita]